LPKPSFVIRTTPKRFNEHLAGNFAGGLLVCPAVSDWLRRKRAFACGLAFRPVSAPWHPQEVDLPCVAQSSERISRTTRYGAENFVFASSRLTHRGWQAETAALAVAESIALTVRTQSQPEADQVLDLLRSLSDQAEWQTALSRIESSLVARHSVSEFIRTLGLEKGVTGYSLHVVPVTVFTWLRHPGDFRTALVSALECGGDTDTVGAILGALAGATVGKQGTPADWLANIGEWPRSVSFMERVAARMAEQKGMQQPLGPVRYFWLGLIRRNILFLVAVLLHGFRRLAPPY
jgi:hypothetical protein